MVKRTINVNLDAYEKFRKISMTRPQDATYAETFDHILLVYGDLWRYDRPPKDARELILEKQKLEKEAKKV